MGDHSRGWRSTSRLVVSMFLSVFPLLAFASLSFVALALALVGLAVVTPERAVTAVTLYCAVFAAADAADVPASSLALAAVPAGSCSIVVSHADLCAILLAILALVTPGCSNRTAPTRRRTGHAICDGGVRVYAGW